MEASTHGAELLRQFLDESSPLGHAVDMREFIVDGLAIGLQRLYDPEGEDAILACADVAPVPQERAEYVYRALMQANNLWAGTQGCSTLGLYGEPEVVVLSRQLRLGEASPERLESLLKTLARDVRLWRAWLTAPAGSHPPSTPA